MEPPYSLAGFDDDILSKIIEHLTPKEQSEASPVCKIFGRKGGLLTCREYRIIVREAKKQRIDPPRHLLLMNTVAKVKVDSASEMERDVLKDYFEGKSFIFQSNFLDRLQSLNFIVKSAYK